MNSSAGERMAELNLIVIEGAAGLGAKQELRV